MKFRLLHPFPALLFVGCATTSIPERLQSSLSPLSTAIVSVHEKTDGLKAEVISQSARINDISGTVAKVDSTSSQMLNLIDSLRVEIEDGKNQVPQLIKERVVEKVQRIESQVEVIGGLSLEKQKDLFDQINAQKEVLNQQMKSIGSRLDSLQATADPSSIMDNVAMAGLFGWVALLGALLTKVLRKPSTGRE
tara:strand:- start:12 stop:590 length:579 start_codon:yes stop_codon:yes gene_type:complete